jgi:hypothetical protein
MESNPMKGLKFAAIISPVIFIVCWGIALPSYGIIDKALIYAYIDLALNVLVLILLCTFNPEHIVIGHIFIGLILSSIGWVWFRQVTTQSIFQFAVTKGAVNSSPLLIRVMYVQLWYRFVVYSFLGSIYIFGLIKLLFIHFKKKKSIEPLVDDTQPNEISVFNVNTRIGRLLNNLIPGQTVQSNKPICLICKSDVLDDFRDLRCGHSFHNSCLQIRLEVDGVYQCPICHVECGL